MAHANQVSLDKTLAEYFPEYAERIEYSDQITVRMMVRHRSGIPNYTNSPGFWVNQPNERDSALLFALDLPASFKPDKKYEYSNTNYLLLRQLIEKITGEDSHAYIKQNILDPLGLKNTYGSLDEVNMNDMMSGYYVGYEEDLKYKDQGMVASAEDVGKFIRALNDGSIFSEGEQEIYSSIYVYDHTGLVPGYQSIARYHKDIDAVVVQFMNTTDFEGYNWSLSEVFYKRVVKILKKSR